MRYLLPVVVLALGGCTHWAASTRPIETVVAPAAKPAKSIRVTLRSLQQMVVLNPAIRGDSLTGTRMNCAAEPCTPSGPVAISLADIFRLETRKINPEATAYSILGLGGATAFIVIALAMENWRFGQP